MENKNGSHVGMMLSFAIFIVFLIFIYSAMEPMLKKRSDAGNLLDYTKEKIIEKSSAELTRVVVSSAGECMSVIFSAVGIGNGNNAIVEDESENIINSGFNGDNLIIDPVNGLAWIIFSTEFEHEEKTDSGCVSPTIKSISKNIYVFKKKIEELKSSYYSDYASLKNDLKIPERENFAFSFTDRGGNVLEAQEKIPENTNVYSEKNQILYVDGDGEVSSGFLTVKIW